jgi:hypothetical protein
MKQIKAQRFFEMISANPNIFKDWETPLEITEYVDCKLLKITHLSKYLIFSGKDNKDIVADFSFCPHLKIATGTFHGCVSFSNTKIEKIENLTVTKPDENGVSANFYGYQELRIATGKYPSFANFSDSGVQSIENLHIENPDIDGDFAAFYKCPKLLTLQGWDLSKKIIIEPEKLAAEKARKALIKFHKNNQPEELPFL